MKRTSHPPVKIAVIKRLGRSPDRGDAVVMAYTKGQNTKGWQAGDPSLREIKVIRGHEAKRRR